MTRSNRRTSPGCTARTVESVNAGREPFPGEHGLAELMAETASDGRLRATTDYAEAIPGADAVVVVVPLLVDDEARPDFSILDSATTSIAPLMSPGALVVYETTMPVGVTRHRWLPMLETSGLREGTDFHLTYSPERVLTGLDVLADQKFAMLSGHSVGLVTNQTGIDMRGRRAIDLIASAPGVRLQAIFSPEHGLMGVSNTDVPHSRDVITGRPIWSLYGVTRRPTSSMRAQTSF